MGRHCLTHPSSFRLHPSKKWPSPHGEGEGRTYIRESRAVSPRRTARGSGRAWPFTGLPRIAVAHVSVERHERVTEIAGRSSGSIARVEAAPLRRLRATQRHAPSSLLPGGSCIHASQNRENTAEKHSGTKAALRIRFIEYATAIGQAVLPVGHGSRPTVDRDFRRGRSKAILAFTQDCNSRPSVVTEPTKKIGRF